MKSFIVFALFVAAAVALPVDPDDDTEISEFISDDGLGSYGRNVEISNGSSRQQKTDKDMSARNSYSYTGPDGVKQSFEYVADKDGFHLVGSH